MTLIVNGEKIEDSAIQREYERLRPDYERVFVDQSPEEQKAQLLEWSRENVIENVLLNQEAEKRDGQIPEADVESVLAEMKEQYKEQLPEELNDEDKKKIRKQIGLQMKVEQMLRDVCKDIPNPSKEAVSEYYEENKEQFESAEQIRVGHIVKHINWQSDESAAHSVLKKAQDELNSGAVFETLAEKYSDCPENGGDLGYITKGQMVEEFDDVVFNLGVGQISDIFRTRFGFHIAKVYDRKPAVVRSMEEVKEIAVNALKEQMRREAVDEFVDGLKNEAGIEEV